MGWKIETFNKDCRQFTNYLAWLLIILLFSGCAESAFLKAKQMNTFESYGDFLDDYGDSEFAVEALQLKVQKAFDMTRQKDTLEAYKQFLSDYGDSQFADEATYRKIKRLFEITGKISVYDKKGAVLASNDFYILNMDRGTRRSFEATIHSVKADEFDKYTIKFNKGS